MSPAPAALVLAALTVAALLVSSTWAVAVIAAGLALAVWRAPAERRWPYLVGTFTSALFVVIVTHVNRDSVF